MSKLEDVSGMRSIGAAASYETIMRGILSVPHKDILSNVVILRGMGKNVCIRMGRDKKLVKISDM